MGIGNPHVVGSCCMEMLTLQKSKADCMTLALFRAADFLIWNGRFLIKPCNTLYLPGDFTNIETSLIFKKYFRPEFAFCILSHLTLGEEGWGVRGVLGGRGLGLRMGEEGGWCWGLLNFAVPASLEFIYIKLCRFHSFPSPLSHTLAWPIEIYFHIFILWNICS